MLRSTAPVTTSAIRLLSAIGDSLAGHGSGFSMHVAYVAANFALHRKCEPEMVAASYFAAALHEIGAVQIVRANNTSEREAEIDRWDIPAAGAAIAATIPGLPPSTGDYIRWHCEAFDGTGYPDRLRWNGIPQAAMAVNIARGFILAIEAQGEFASPPEALFTLATETGRRYSVNVVREFREFYAAAGQGFDAPCDPQWSLDELDGTTVVCESCSRIDARYERTAGRGDRMERTVRAIVQRLGDTRIDPENAAFAARLTSLGSLAADARVEDFDPLARLGREARAAQAAQAAAILAGAPDYAALAPILGATAEWFDGSGLPQRRRGDAIDPIARVLAVALAIEGLRGSHEAPIRLGAAAGTQFDPAVIGAYMASLGGTS
ncbi:MAG: hypothetical protein NVSMB5_12100 [Candidatus Velthaea sp.]